MSYRTDKIRKALERFLPDLLFVRDDVGGCVVKYLGTRESDQGWLQWFAINRIVTGLGGRWIPGNRFDREHWRIPQNGSK